jgi:hypothetical protein
MQLANITIYPDNIMQNKASIGKPNGIIISSK